MMRELALILGLGLQVPHGVALSLWLDGYCCLDWRRFALGIAASLWLVWLGSAESVSRETGGK